MSDYMSIDADFDADLDAFMADFERRTAEHVDNDGLPDEVRDELLAQVNEYEERELLNAMYIYDDWVMEQYAAAWDDDEGCSYWLKSDEPDWGWTRKERRRARREKKAKYRARRILARR